MTIEFWYLIGAALVFWMQAGFAMVETGFTRAKNAGNIIMKNLMDFCIGTIVFSLLGYTLMMGEDTLFGLIGLPNMELWSNFKAFIASPAEGFTAASTFVFNLVFCATTATIVSGAMAERTKFSAYCIYSAVISLFIYPIEAHWIWGGGWLSQLGFHDFAGSTAVHMVGGLCALIGAKMVGPRIGKYTKDGKANAIPGHSLTLAALGCFPVVLLVRLQRLLHRFDDGGRDIGERQPHLRQYQPGRSCGNLCGDDHYLEPLQKARRLDDAERFSGRACGHHGRLRRSGPVRRGHYRADRGLRSGVRR